MFWALHIVPGEGGRRQWTWSKIYLMCYNTPSIECSNAKETEFSASSPGRFALSERPSRVRADSRPNWTQRWRENPCPSQKVELVRNQELVPHLLSYSVYNRNEVQRFTSGVTGRYLAGYLEEETFRCEIRGAMRVTTKILSSWVWACKFS